jgi:hypothetical protein
MQANDPYRALRSYKNAATMTWVFQEGDGVPQGTVDTFGLVVGVDVVPVRDDVIAKPESGADRADWEAFALGQGWTLDQAHEASLKDLRAIPGRDPNEPVRLLNDPSAAPERPDASAVKADWQAWAVANGADEAWANDKATTKADLQDYQPGPDAHPAVSGDPVAENADELANG